MAVQIPLHQRKIAPLTKVEITHLKRNLADLPATAERKGTTLDKWDLANETHAGKVHFDLGCWLYYYNKPGTGRLDSVSARVDCLRRVFEDGLPSPNPGYRFFTAFDFGQRDFESMLEQGDAREVVDGLRAYAKANPSFFLLDALKYMGWIEGDEQADQASEEEALAPAP